MGSYLSLLGAIAQVVGGTQPTLAQLQAGLNGIGGDLTGTAKLDIQTRQQPYWYSGSDVTDGSGVAGLAGCYSLPTEVVGATPVGMVLPSGWNPVERMPYQGTKNRIDDIRVRIMIASGDLMAITAQLVDYADLIPTAFDHNMQLFASVGVGQADAGHGRFLEVEWGGKGYFCVEFTIATLRSIPVTRTP